MRSIDCMLTVQGIILVYDVTNEKSFENIKTWIRLIIFWNRLLTFFSNIEQHASEDVEKMILGNKCDMDEKRVVTKEQGQKVNT
jgi:GTPase SAR1 family protein